MKPVHQFKTKLTVEELSGDTLNMFLGWIISPILGYSDYFIGHDQEYREDSPKIEYD